MHDDRAQDNEARRNASSQSEAKVAGLVAARERLLRGGSDCVGFCFCAIGISTGSTGTPIRQRHQRPAFQ